MWIAPPVLDAIVDRTLAEDLSAGDLTTEATIDESAMASAVVVARHGVVACGYAVFARVFERLDARCQCVCLVNDGVSAPPGAALWRVQGPARALLMAERSALNLTQRLTGIATMARRYCDALPPGSTTRITDTRKTTPGLRVLERYAVRCGGAFNHRDSLGSAVLIKDNHLLAAGGITVALQRARARAPHTCAVEIEVGNLVELDEALAGGADIILLDNFSLPDLAEGVRRCRGKAMTEASGGITLAQIADVAATGVDVISVGALTHSVMAADLGLDFEPAT